MRYRAKGLAFLCASATLVFPVYSAFAQNNAIEEVIVTGSYIKRSKMDAANPVETVTVEDIQSSGYTQLGEYIRDLTYTANIDTVANVLATRGGIQDSNRTAFNLRGLGEASTLTLFDGRRTLNSGSVSDIMPDIALRSVDIILDGGAATYGTDAVAGVVNLVPLQSYDGVKLRTFYDRDQDGDTYQYKVSGLFGKSSDAADLVLAVEYSARPDPLRNFERPEYLRADNDTSISGLLPNGFLDTGVPPTAGTTAIDPDCGMFNGSQTDDGRADAFPSGLRLTSNCTTEYGRWHDTARAQDALTAFANLTVHLTDQIDLRMQYNRAHQIVEFNTSGTTAERGSNLAYIVPGGPTPIGNDGTPNDPHPNMPAGWDGNFRLRDWRPFGNVGTTPSHIDRYGAQTPKYTFDYTSYAFGTEFEIGDSGWSGQAWFTNQQRVDHIKGRELSRERLGLALNGKGGPSGDQWINPFFSRDPASADFCDAAPGETGPGGCIGSNNTQEMVDWVFVDRDYDDAVEDYRSLEGFVSTNDLFELPAGPVGMAVGAQYRWNQWTDRPSQAAAVGDSYSTSILTPADPGVRADAEVYALFTEWFVPIVGGLSATVAVRYEDFKDFGFDATVPKISLLYTPTDWLSLRASWGEGFLVPTLEEQTVRAVADCAEQFGGEDPILKVPLAGSQSCTNGSDTLVPEESTIFNIGITLQPIDDLELSLDYQQVEYTDQIRQLSLIDTVEQDFDKFLAANGLTESQLDALSDMERTDLARAWALVPSRVVRNGATGGVELVNRISVNVAEVNVSVLDLRARYLLDIGDYGSLSMDWSTTNYTKYEYIDTTGVTTDALGKRNDSTDIVPPLPDYKHQGRIAWLYGNQAVSLVGKGFSSIDFDGTTGPGFGPGLGAPVPEEIDGQWIFNLRYSYAFDQLFGVGGAFEVAFGANNVLDERAQRLPVQGGFESRLEDPYGRMLYLELNYSAE